MKFQMENSKDLPSQDSDLATHIKETRDIERAVEKLHEAINIGVQQIIQNSRDHKENDKAKIGSMVD